MLTRDEMAAQADPAGTLEAGDGMGGVVKTEVLGLLEARPVVVTTFTVAVLERDADVVLERDVDVVLERVLVVNCALAVANSAVTARRAPLKCILPRNRNESWERVEGNTV